MTPSLFFPSIAMRKFFVTIATACAIAAQPLHAQTTTIGASRTDSYGPFTKAAGGFQSVGQSFQAPSGALRLQSFSLQFSDFNNGADLKFDAYLFAFNAAERRVTGSALWSFSNIAGSSNLFDFDTKTFAMGNVMLTPGTTYIVLVSTSAQGDGVPEDAANLIGVNTTDEYTGGSFWYALNGSNFDLLRNQGAFIADDYATDASFSATFLTDAQVVPEPASVLLTGAGLLLVGVVVRRRHLTAA